MRIAFTTKGTEWNSAMDPRFGRTAFLLLYDEEKNELTHFDNTSIADEAHGAGPQTAQKLFELKADILITGNVPGGNATTVLELGGIKIFTGADEMTVKEALELYRRNKLKKI